MKNSFKKKKGFTIAEIVIALLLVAGIAMILMPILVADTEDQVLYTSLNKTYTLLRQVHQAESLLQARGKIVGGSANVKFMNAITMTLKCIGLTSERTIEVRNNKFNQYIGNYHIIDGGENIIINYTQFSAVNQNDNTVILKNGVFISISDDNNYIVVDLNGKKGPNKTGRDVFLFQIINNAFVPTPAGGCTQIGGNIASSGGCAKHYLERGKID